MEERKLKMVCIHEAAHAVAFVRLLSCTPLKVSIEESILSNGFTDVLWERKPENAVKLFACCFAGPVAHALVGGEPNISGDMACMVSMAGKMNFSDEEFAEYLGDGFERASLFVRENLPEIERVARKLFAEITLTGEQVLAEIDGSNL